MTDRDPYSRVYWSIRSDERFAGVYSDDAALAAWLRLLIAADGVYPAPADIPAWLKPDTLALLAERGLIELVDSFHYRIHGLEAERERRSGSARSAAQARWDATRNATRNATASAPRNATRNAAASDGALLAEPSRAETSRAEQAARIASESETDPLVLYAQLAGRRPTQTVVDWVNRLATAYGDEAVCGAIVAAVRDGVAVNRLLGDVEERLAAAKRESLRVVRKRKTEPWREEYKAMIQASYEETPA